MDRMWMYWSIKRRLDHFSPFGRSKTEFSTFSNIDGMRHWTSIAVDCGWGRSVQATTTDDDKWAWGSSCLYLEAQWRIDPFACFPLLWAHQNERTNDSLSLSPCAFVEIWSLSGYRQHNIVWTQTKKGQAKNTRKITTSRPLFRTTQQRNDDDDLVTVIQQFGLFVLVWVRACVRNYMWLVSNRRLILLRLVSSAHFAISEEEKKKNEVKIAWPWLCTQDNETLRCLLVQVVILLW